MEDGKKTLTEYEKEISDAENLKKQKSQRRKVNAIKRTLMITFLFVCAIPITFCTFLMVKMNRLDHRLEQLVERVEEGRQSTDSREDSTQLSAQSFAEDQYSYSDLEKGTESDGVRVTLTNSKDGDLNVKAMDEPDPEIETKPENLNGKKVYLTFDDGPSVYTGELLDILKSNNVKATFFVVYNSNVHVTPYYKRIVDEGHAIGMHSYSHDYDEIYASEESFKQDVVRIHNYILKQTGVDSRLYRFPGGSSNNVSKVDIQSLMEYLYNEGITYYDWNSLSGDAVDASLTPEQLNENILGYVRANATDSVVLLHDLQNNHATIEGLQSLIETLKEEGYELCAIDENTPLVQHVSYKGVDE
ncbi:MAG: polysaccharide deacetylase family protein [Wujia sp.]